MARSAAHGWRPQRELAARNETAIVEAARRLFREQEVGAVDVRQIASTAGVGVGTVYRRFHDKSALLAAVIGDDERRLQDKVLRGRAPLGPGAPAGERLAAFLRALARLTEQNLDLLLATDLATVGGRFRLGAYQAWRLHVATLIGQLRPNLRPDDAGWFADALLAPLAPDLYAHQRRERGMRPAQIRANLDALAATIAHPGISCNHM